MKPKRSRGQNFLVDQNMLKKIVATANIAPTDTIVEIGAGTGNLTVHLAARAQRVIAIEIDRGLIPLLHDRCVQYPNVEIIYDDARTFNPTSYTLHATSYCVVANIPYNITSLLIRRLLEADPPPTRMVLLVQKEVAERICAKPPHMSILSVAVQYYADPRILFSVPRTCFSPRPRVDSALVSFRRRPESRLKDSSFFFSVVHAGFAHKRKLLVSNLTPLIPTSQGRGTPLSLPLYAQTLQGHAPALSIILAQAGIPPSARAQELSVAQWKELASVLFPFSRG